MLTTMLTRLRACVSTVNQSSSSGHIVRPFLRMHHLLRLLAIVCLCTVLLTLRFGEDAHATSLFIPQPQIGESNLEQLHEVRSLQAPGDGVAAIALSQDGAILAYGSYSDHQIYLVDPHTGDLHSTLTGSSDHVTELAFSPDHRLLASWAKDDKVRLWDVQTGEEVTTIAIDQIRKLLFTPDGTQLLIARVSDPVQVVVWDLINQAEVKRINNVFLGISLSPDGRRMAAGGRNDELHVIDMTSGQPEADLRGHKGWIAATAFDPTGKFIATGSDDRTLKLWEIATRQEWRSFAGPESEVDFVTFSPDGALLVSLDSGMNVKRLPGGQVELSMSLSPEARVARFWDVSTGEQIHLLEDEAGIYHIAFNRNWTMMVTTGSEGAIQIWEVPTQSSQPTPKPVKPTATPHVATEATTRPTHTPAPTTNSTATARPTGTAIERATATATPTHVQSVAAIVQVRTLNVRTGPGTSYGIKGQVHQGDVLRVSGESDDCAWLQVTTPDGTTGWVSGAAQYVWFEAGCNGLVPGTATLVPTFTPTLTATSVPSSAPTANSTTVLLTTTPQPTSRSTLEPTLIPTSGSTSTISGKVFRADTGELVAGAEVSLSIAVSEGENEKIAETITDEFGRYSFTDLEADEYSMSVAVEYDSINIMVPRNKTTC